MFDGAAATADVVALEEAEVRKSLEVDLLN